jgi:predicted helicase
MAERRIVELTGRGIVCFISNYSWLDGLSFTGMREKYIDTLDKICIDNLHGDRIISEYAPDGRTSETVFAILGQSVGIKVGTAISTLISRNKRNSDGQAVVLYRDFDEARALERRSALLQSLTEESGRPYRMLSPLLKLGLPFKPAVVSRHYSEWPSLPALFPTWFAGVQTKRDQFLVDIDRDNLTRRIEDYFDQTNPTNLS